MKKRGGRKSLDAQLRENYEDPVMLTRLLAKGADIHFNDDIILQLAVEDAQATNNDARWDIVKILIDNCANVFVNEHTTYEIIKGSSYAQRWDIVKLLIERYPQIIEYSRGMLIVEIIIYGPVELLKELIDAGLDVNDQFQGDDFGGLPLAVAIDADRTDMAKLLIESNAIYNHEDLAASASRGQIDIVTMLIDRGVDATIDDMALLYTIEEKPEKPENYLDIVKILLEQYHDPNDMDITLEVKCNGKLIPYRVHNRTALEIVKRTNIATLEALIEDGYWTGSLDDDAYEYRWQQLRNKYAKKVCNIKTNIKELGVDEAANFLYDEFIAKY